MTYCAVLPFICCSIYLVDKQGLFTEASPLKDEEMTTLKMLVKVEIDIQNIFWVINMLTMSKQIYVGDFHFLFCLYNSCCGQKLYLKQCFC